MNRSRAFIACACACVAATAAACTGRPPPPPPPGATFVEDTRAIADDWAATRSSGGFALGDIDADGELDLLATTGYSLRNILSGDKVAPGPQVVLRGDGKGRFHDATPLRASSDRDRGSKLPLMGAAMAPLLADLDGDGDLDAIVPLGGSAPSQAVVGGATAVYENVSGTLVARPQLPTTEGVPYAVCPGDFDRDQDLDVFVAKLGAPDVLYRNDGDLRFTDVTSTSGSLRVPSGWTNACLALDVDDDGDLDLFTAYEFVDLGVVLHRNEGSPGELVFSDASAELLGDATGHEGNWMGFAAGDPDGDGDVDVFVTNMGIGAYAIGGTSVTADPRGSPLHMMLQNQGDGTFKDIAPDVVVDGLEPLPPPLLEYPDSARGLAALEFGWTAWFFDYDNDADDDLLFFGSWAFSSDWQIVGSRAKGANPGRLLENDGTGRYREVAGAAGIVNVERNTQEGFIANGWGCDVADLDHDGFLDVVVANQFFGEDDHPQGVRVWRNQGNENAGFFVDLVGRASAPHAFGARVEVDLQKVDGPDERRTLTRVRASASSISAAPTSPLHFGVPAGWRVLEVRVRWPASMTTTVIAGDELAPRALLVVEEP